MGLSIHSALRGWIKEIVQIWVPSSLTWWRSPESLTRSGVARLPPGALLSEAWSAQGPETLLLWDRVQKPQHVRNRMPRYLYSVVDSINGNVSVPGYEYSYSIICLKYASQPYW